MRVEGGNKRSPFYANDVTFDGLMGRSAVQLRLLMERGGNRGYFPELYKLLFIYNNREEEKAARREFEQAGLHLKCVDGSRYMGVYFGPREELEAWGGPMWRHGPTGSAL